MVKRVVNTDTTHRPGMNQVKEVEKSLHFILARTLNLLIFLLLCWDVRNNYIKSFKYNENLSCTSSKQG